MNKEGLKQKALDFIHLKDLETGGKWSAYDDEIANVLSEFAEQYAQSQTESLKKEIEELKSIKTVKDFLESRLVIGVKIKLGRNCAEAILSEEGEILELVEGYFEYDNGLYTETHTAPSIWNEEAKEFHSIYHLFENDLSGFMDSEILTPPNQ